MELKYNKIGNNQKSSSESKFDEELIKVRAIISCPTCNYHKRFKNQFHKKDIETMVVAIKCMDWLTCRCGELLNLNLEFEI